MVAVFEPNKFLVLNRKHIENLPIHIREDLINALSRTYGYLPDNNYYVCNRDEPYAMKVLHIILEGEDAKNAKN